MPETYVHVQDKNREISPLGREVGYGGKDLEKRWVLRREWKTPWDTPTTDLGAESEPGTWLYQLLWWRQRHDTERIHAHLGALKYILTYLLTEAICLFTYSQSEATAR